MAKDNTLLYVGGAIAVWYLFIRPKNTVPGAVPVSPITTTSALPAPSSTQSLITTAGTAVNNLIKAITSGNTPTPGGNSLTAAPLDTSTISVPQPPPLITNPIPLPQLDYTSVVNTAPETVYQPINTEPADTSNFDDSLYELFENADYNTKMRRMSGLDALKMRAKRGNF